MADPTTSELHQIGTVVDRVGLSVRTIRHYDEIGLVVPSGRSPGGFRLYTDEDVERLLYVKAMKPLGFTLEEHGELLGYRDALMSGRQLSVAERDALRASAERAAERCVVLERQLREAQSLSKLLRMQSDDAERQAG